MERPDKRALTQMRPISFLPDFQKNPCASILAVFGDTRVLCAVSVETALPRWMKEQEQPGGWITAEYQMLPGATDSRAEREVKRGHLSGRSAEIQRLIGRSLRAMVDLSKLPGLTLHIDCDVLDADGGTRCAAVCGAALALELACHRLVREARLAENPLQTRVAAVSVGLLDGAAFLDLCYTEDSRAAVDMNVVMTSGGRFVELQGTAEKASFSDSELSQLLTLAKAGLQQIFAAQERIIQEQGFELEF